MYVKFSGPYADFIAGRDVDSALHYADGSDDTCIGIVGDLRAGDVLIEEAEYLSLAQAISAHNIANAPEPDPVPVEVNRGDLLLAIFAVLGKDTARGLARDYPDAVLAIDHGNWPVLAESMGDMLSDGALTQQQFADLGALFEQFGVSLG